MDERFISFALEEGFSNAAVVNTSDIIFDAAFRPFCEENLCGHYGMNYTCPPECGSPEYMKQRVLSHKKALVLQTMWSIPDFSDDVAVKKAKKSHNEFTFNLIKRLKAEGKNGLMVGASGCSLCEPCLLVKGKPCKLVEKRYSCMSAYCIYVKKLAEQCNMVYDYKDGLLPFFGMYVFD